MTEKTISTEEQLKNIEESIYHLASSQLKIIETVQYLSNAILIILDYVNKNKATENNSEHVGVNMYE